MQHLKNITHGPFADSGLILGRRSWSFLGLTVKEHYDNSGWYIEALIKTDEQLRESSEAVASKVLTPEQKLFNESVLASLPGEAQQEIRYLLMDRENVSTNGRHTRKWQLIDIKPVTKQTPMASNWLAFGWTRPPRQAEWDLIIKGETIDPTQVRVPDRRYDPFRKTGRARFVIEEPRTRHRIIPQLPQQQPLPYTQPPSRYQREALLERSSSRIPRVTNTITPDEAEQKLQELLVNKVSDKIDTSAQ